ncbi:MAG: ectonucleotide pyrophosphatase/phosphodiesterase [Alphaproteobacteria bacterium]|nr:ectonucleotide pyrophosphatase/phosphodiesterase [Alphaproteobacteria bacterium]MBU1512630.1 ectonucleotide pyrophosphatase/phosphodiesterase [Alphaproteobacteria bacterium]MBU2095024.1 ectonucleotide pyrophosphatase/phosphodiesterase [Alphaproteobacteria bacterium]MBU2151857.1 ectonucleotide pyrophosphatase/phosphodiesterase [Alphaproteobacteria bacterium]MBU2306256.1 ectonucleotide pyrophosphatase/phosphodiesterase [Alphaproteobacteria bacterium]
MLRWLTLCWTVLVLAACATSPPPSKPQPLTILVSIDGFRPDYLDRGVTPVLSGLAADGARASMRPSFPTKTFPNHYALVTGLRPDRNGVVENNMEDPAIPGVTFKMSNAQEVRDGRWWNEGEPIWVAAERAGIVSATMFWPGSEAAIRGVRPSFTRAFDQSVSADARVDQVLAWLDLPAARRPRLVTLYFDDVDTAGHDFGPDSAELNAAAAKVDAAMGRLQSGLTTRGLEANVVVVADHGMAPLSDDRRLFLDDILPVGAYRYLATGAFATLYPTPGHEAEVAGALMTPRAHLQCWAKADIPARFHYGRNPRVAPYLCLPDTGWRITTRDDKPSKPERGAHGYDNFSPDMAAIFIAQGPAFRRGVIVPTFDNVSVYPLLARLIGVPPAPNDGHLRDVAAALTR